MKELNIIKGTDVIKKALVKINNLTIEKKDMFLTLFVLSKEGKLEGTLTDGDIRRGLMGGASLEDEVRKIMKKDFYSLEEGQFSVNDIIELRRKKINLVPVLDREKKIKRIYNLKKNKSILPLDAVIMAGGEGQRLRPYTLNTPKPLLVVGDKPIIEHNIDRLIGYGIENIIITIKYLGEQLVDYFNENKKECEISFVKENKKLGTIGAVSLIDSFCEDYVLIMNSDLLTNIDFEEFFLQAMKQNADMAIASIPYRVNIPYAVLEHQGDRITKLTEKPTYTYHSNAGIYIIRKKILNYIPKNEHFNATDLIDVLIKNDKVVTYYDIVDYWLDIGKMEDFEKAKEDIKHLKL